MDFGAVPKHDFVHKTTLRLIPSHYIIDEPALSPLADNDSELAELEALESLTSGRIQPNQRTTTDFLPTEQLTPDHGPNSHLINAAFSYSPAQGNRFNDHRRGAWYAAYGQSALETAQAEILFHRTAELENTRTDEDRFVYGELFASFATEFHDINGVDGLDCLNPDPAIAYPKGQALASYIRSQNGNGLLYPSVRNPGGRCLVAMRPYVVQNVRTGSVYELNWNGSWEAQASKVTLMGKS